MYASGSPIPITVLGLDRGEPVERRRNRGRVAKPGHADLPSVLINLVRKRPTGRFFRICYYFCLSWLAAIAHRKLNSVPMTASGQKAVIVFTLP